MKNNDVFMIGWEYPPHNSGGLGVACQGLTKALSSQSSQIFFTLPYQPSGNFSHMSTIDCSHSDWKKIKNQPPFLPYLPIESRQIIGRRPELKPRSVLEKRVKQYSQVVGKKAKRHQADYSVIHAHDWMSFPAGINLKKKTGKPLVAHVHSTEYDRIPNGPGSNFIINSEYDGISFSDRVIAVSFFTKKLLIDKYKIDPNKIDVVHNGIDPVSRKSSRDSFAKNRPVIVFMGRLTGQKGPDYFLSLAKKIVSQVPEALFVVAGSGDMYHELLFKSANHGLSGNVLFSGFVRGDQKAKLLDRADVFVMPSLSEPFGLVALEAAQRKTPVIVSKTVGVSEVLPSSISVDFWDLDLMAQKVLELIFDKELANKVVRNQARELKRNTWSKAARKVEQVYRRVVSQ